MHDIETLYFDTLDSTNEEAKRRFQEGLIQQTTCILANTQTQGKGTQGRSWNSPAGAGLYFSLIQTHLQGPREDIQKITQFNLEPNSFQTIQPIPATPLFTLAAGISCIEALKELTQITFYLKPINDLYAYPPEEDLQTENLPKTPHKLGGILTESITQEGQIKALITGIGINLFDTPREMSKEIHLAPTSKSQTAESPNPSSQGVQPISLENIMRGHFFQNHSPQDLQLELARLLCKSLQYWYHWVAEGEKTLTSRKKIFETWKQYQLPNTSTLESLLPSQLYPQVSLSG
jgi:biotin-(acetyl-CoA carboxylase) ligase